MAHNGVVTLDTCEEKVDQSQSIPNRSKSLENRGKLLSIRLPYTVNEPVRLKTALSARYGPPTV